MRIFLAGIMQGSHLGEVLHHQGYRQRLKQLLLDRWPQAEVYDPLADHADSLSYDDRQARQVFLHHIELCRQVDVLLAYLPEASMGTAIEMWEAYRAGKWVVSISPLEHNWVVKFCSHVQLRDLDALAAALGYGQLDYLAQAAPP